MTNEPTVRPCIHPWCTRNGHDPELTRGTMCPPCRRHYRREIDWLVIDYVTIKHNLPQPITNTENTRRTSSRTYGHPAEWASDQAELIAAALNQTEDALREHLGHTPALPEKASETRRVNAAYRYLTDQFDALTTYPDARDTAVYLHDLHANNRRALGLTRLYQRLSVPCPDCDTASLVRSVGLITCGDCGREIREEHFGLFARLALDSLIAEYDTRTQELA